MNRSHAGLVPASLNEGRLRTLLRFAWGSAGSTDTVTLTKNLSVMLAAGLTIPEALEALVAETAGPFKHRLRAWHADVRSGRPFAEAIRDSARLFGPVFMNAVRVGEQSGTLAANLTRVAEQLEQELRLRRSVRGAMAYPAFVLVTTGLIGGGLAIFVLPKLARVFQSLRVELPWTTRLLIALADLLDRYGFVLLPGSVLVLLAFALLLCHPRVRPLVERALLRAPLLGRFFHDVNRARFCRTLGTLLQTGLPLPEALTLSEDALSNVIYRRSISQLRSRVESGQGLAGGLALFPRLYPTMIQRAVAVGERSAGTGDSLTYLARFYEDKVAVEAKAFATLVEPILLLIIGLSIGFLAISIFTPIYSVTSGVRL
ncbi:type II secretion system F family protein [Candidatus Uhrbacteria bacterium]|nr:type II secretion system F family protein [Candidatus Uhrbacteria bacterium]